jgi:hypothetical protein
MECYAKRSFPFVQNLSQLSVHFGMFGKCRFEFEESDFEIFVNMFAESKLSVRCVVHLCVRDNEQELTLID